jgi:hypothetical protein
VRALSPRARLRALRACSRRALSALFSSDARSLLCCVSCASTQERLRDFFSAFGAVTDVYLPRDRCAPAVALLQPQRRRDNEP